jgi:hypothetical protein
MMQEKEKREHQAEVEIKKDEMRSKDENMKMAIDALDRTVLPRGMGIIEDLLSGNRSGNQQQPQQPPPVQAPQPSPPPPPATEDVLTFDCQNPACHMSLSADLNKKSLFSCPMCGKRYLVENHDVKILPDLVPEPPVVQVPIQVPIPQPEPIQQSEQGVIGS